MRSRAADLRHEFTGSESELGKGASENSETKEL